MAAPFLKDVNELYGKLAKEGGSVDLGVADLSMWWTKQKNLASDLEVLGIVSVCWIKIFELTGFVV